MEKTFEHRANAVLCAMGIAQYRLRKTCWVLVEGIQPGSEAETLLNKMLRVLELSKRRVRVNPDLQERCFLPKVMLVMGKVPTRTTHGYTTVCTHHPTEILSDPRLKRKAYEDLMLVKEAMFHD